MKKNTINFVATMPVLWLLLLLLTGCKRDLATLQPATYNANGEVFIDAFSKNLVYAAFGGTVPTAFNVDSSITYNHSAASMRIEVPDKNNPAGSYAGGSFFVTDGRNLSGFDALVFWAKASGPETVGVFGFGNDFGANQYQVSLNNVPVNSNWQQYIIPIPDASKLNGEKGLFYFAAGPDANGKGYTMWVDNVQFVKLGTISNPTPVILNGSNISQTSYVGVTTPITGISASFNLPNGINDTLGISASYFTFTSSNPATATVSSLGVITTTGAGTAVITATVGAAKAKGSLTINSPGVFVPAPTPTVDAANVLSVFSDTYTSVPVDYYNGYWAPFQTTQSADFEVSGNHVLNYTNFNFVGIQMSSPTNDISSMSDLHLDIYFPSALASGATFTIQVLDFGANGVPGGGDDVSDQVTYQASALQSTKWNSFDIPLSSLPKLTTRQHIGQIIFVGTGIPGFFADNIYFWRFATEPTTAAPTPTYDAASVLSIFSDAYTNVAGTDFFPNWGQATVVSQPTIAGKKNLLYTGLNYEGTQLAAPQNVSSYGFLHIDYYSPNASALNVFLINSGAVTGGNAVQTSYPLTVPTNGVWTSVDIPLSKFAPVSLSKVDQMMFTGNGNIYFGNIYFHN
jgi:hypothetical protein